MQRSVFAAAKQPRHSIKSPTQTDTSHSRNGKLWNVADGLCSSGLMLAARTTLPHFSVSSAMSFPKSAGEPGSTAPPRSASCALILGSARAGVDLVVELINDLGGRVPGAPMPNQAARLVARTRIRPQSGCPAVPANASRVVTASARSLPALMYSMDAAHGAEERAAPARRAGR